MRPLISNAQFVGGLAAVIAVAVSPVFAFQQPGEGDLQLQTNQEREIQTAAEQRKEQQARGPSGQFTSLHRGQITIKGEKGEVQTYKTTEETQVLLNGKRAHLQDLKEGDQIQIVMGPGQTALRVLANRGQANPRIPLQQIEDDPSRSTPQTPNRDPNSLLPPNRGDQTDQNTTQRRESRYRPRKTDDDKQSQLDKADQGSSAWLGVMLRKAENQRGVEVVRIYPSGPAARAGLRSGDQVIQVAGKAVSSPEDVSTILKDKKTNQQIKLAVMRDNQEANLTATVGDRRDFLGDARQESSRRDQQEQKDRFDEQGGFDMPFPEHAMMLEQHRRLAEQHQRLEEKLDKVLEELQALKKQMGQQPTPRNNRRN